ncbi:Guanylate kinase [Porphyridium purpureum]|uniref:guanylate kinase n=1 Tax=Porphyridium purpureum TaxID=35688 RepID=A0A5J4YXP9_PORPP|nr:Guanylate kinase [Porphyridium purpureum]|eukprot:POR7449..scf209_3
MGVAAFTGAVSPPWVHMSAGPSCSVAACVRTCKPARRVRARVVHVCKAEAGSDAARSSDSVGETEIASPAGEMRNPSTREIDARGFVVPKVGDIVLYGGKWPGEDAVGLVEKVQYLPERTSYIVDLMELRNVGSQLFAVPSNSNAKKLARKWKDAGAMRVARGASFVASQQAYRVEGVRDGFPKANVKVDDAMRKQYLEEYEALKRELFGNAAVTGAAGTVVAAFGTHDVASTVIFAMGALCGVAYLMLLSRKVDQVQSSTPISMLDRAMVLSRFAMPVVPLLTVYVVQGSTITQTEVVCGSLGFLAYKVPIWQGVFKPMAEEIGKSKPQSAVGMGMKQALNFANRASPSASDAVSQGKHGTADGGSIESEAAFRPVIISGPSGVGKTTLLRMLMEKYPEKYGNCVSHTTRKRRPEEVNGVDYNFVSEDEFLELLRQGAFVEHAYVHGNYYGTSLTSIQELARKQRVCILCIDIQGVETLRSVETFDGLFVWVGPPSLDVLEQRLHERGTEDELAVRLRMNEAVREMSAAATKGYFDRTIINDDLDKAFSELEAILTNK